MFHIFKYIIDSDVHYQINSFTKSILIRGGSRAAATSKMEHFVKIVNGFQPLTIITKRFQPLTIITKRSILDVAAVLDPPLLIQFMVRWSSRVGYRYFMIDINVRLFLFVLMFNIHQTILRNSCWRSSFSINLGLQRECSCFPEVFSKFFITIFW